MSTLSIERGQAALDAQTRPVPPQQDEPWEKRRATIIADMDAAKSTPVDSGDDVDVPTLCPPIATPEMFYGLAGEVGRAAAESTEVNPVAAMGYLMTMVSAAVGRDVYLSVGNTFHHCRLFMVHVGRTSRGRKGDAQGAGRRIRSEIENVFEELGHHHSGGLSSREGLAGAIQDPKGDDDENGTDDKRLFVVESEFSNTLAQGRREGNTLTAALRDAWDGNDIKPLVGRYLSDLDVRRIVYGLLQAGLVVVVRPVGQTGALPNTPVRKPKTEAVKEQEKSLVNKLIARIRQL